MEVNNFLVLAPVIPGLYRMVILPAAVVCIIQGIIYGIFSKWGFFKFKWITIKWLSIPIVIICTGIGGIGQIFAIVDSVQKNNIQNITLKDGKIFFLFIGIQIIILGIMTILSVIKPNKNKKQD
jgi:hypothetical protein